MARTAMKKYKIALGICGCHVIRSNVIKAHDEREAVIKYLESSDMEVTEEAIEKLLKNTYEHIPTPRKK